MERPLRTRDVDGLRVDEEVAGGDDGRVVASLIATFGEAHEPAHLRGIGALTLAMARDAARHTGAEVEPVLSMTASALRFRGRASAVSEAVAAVTTELASPDPDRLERARRELREMPGDTSARALARRVRFGATGFGSSLTRPLAVLSATVDEVAAWAACWHGGTAAR